MVITDYQNICLAQKCAGYFFAKNYHSYYHNYHGGQLGWGVTRMGDDWVMGLTLHFNYINIK